MICICTHHTVWVIHKTNEGFGWCYQYGIQAGNPFSNWAYLNIGRSMLVKRGNPFGPILIRAVPWILRYVPICLSKPWKPVYFFQIWRCYVNLKTRSMLVKAGNRLAAQNWHCYKSQDAFQYFKAETRPKETDWDCCLSINIRNGFKFAKRRRSVIPFPPYHTFPNIISERFRTELQSVILFKGLSPKLAK